MNVEVIDQLVLLLTIFVVFELTEDLQILAGIEMQGKNINVLLEFQQDRQYHCKKKIKFRIFAIESFFNNNI